MERNNQLNKNPPIPLFAKRYRGTVQLRQTQKKAVIARALARSNLTDRLLRFARNGHLHVNMKEKSLLIQKTT